MSKSPICLFQSYKDCSFSTYGMLHSKLDPCLMVKVSDTKVQGIFGASVDDAICSGSDEFLGEDSKSKAFSSKVRTITGKKSVRINGYDIKHCDRILRMS